MAASSVTGTGTGSVDKYGGGNNLRINSVPLQGPNVVACGIASIEPTVMGGVGGQCFIRTPYVLAMPEDSYAAFVMPYRMAPQPGMFVGGFYAGGDGNGSIIHLMGMTGPGIVNWMIVRQGFGVEATGV